MKTTMNYPKANYLAAFKLPSNDLEKVAGGTNGLRYREKTIYALTQATLTLFGFGSLPDDWSVYANEMVKKEDAVINIMFASFPKEEGFIAFMIIHEYKYLDLSEKYDLLKEVYNKFK